MGNSESVEVPGGGTEGYHILKVQPDSPGAKAGLQPFFDFIISINGVRLDKDDGRLKDILKAGVGKSLPVALYSWKTQTVRSVMVQPSDSWGGQGLLGISIKFCSFETTKDNVWHILEVQPNSPADLAGLKAFSDYIVGSDSILHESDDLYNLIENHDGNPLKLYVYNCDSDNCREVTITPNSRWGGEGLLGCGIGYGYLHRIPLSTLPPPSTAETPKVPTVTSTVTTPTVPSTVSTVSAPQDISHLVDSAATLKLTEVVEQSTQPQPMTMPNVPPSVSLPQLTTPQPKPDVMPQLSGPPPPSAPPTVQPNVTLPHFTMPNIPLQTNVTLPQFPLNPMVSPPVSPNFQPQSVPQIPMYNPNSFPTTNQMVPPYPNVSSMPSNVMITQPTQLIYDPTIAARSAQQLLSGNTQQGT
ncbi:Golgi reassembly-stacking protein 2 [Anthonomus grandis grandis]|uniref:Golgi reassembly-stacking protein 2 n=1 Tax=Anthonomus grandis grandis TaxID=2921223 RepID=UPI0021661B0B|nr:Golgi reassembly-stacking protein 2 [Anthonomus grandis grandis]